MTSYSIKGSPPVRNRIIPIIQSFLELNVEVELLCNDKSISIEDYIDCKKSNAFTQRMATPIARVTRNFIVRALVEIILSFKLLFLAKKSNADIIFITIPSMFLVLPLIFMTNRSMTVVDIRDLTWEYLSESSFFSSFVKKLIRKIVVAGLKRADLFTITNKKELDYIAEIVPNSVKYHLTNGVSLARYKDLVMLESEAVKMDMKITYIGTVGIAQNLITFIKAAELRPMISFQVVGDGIELDRLNKYCRLNEVHNVQFYGSLDWSEILDMYKATDILYANISANYASAVPSKIFEYVSSGVAVIFGSTGVSRDILSKFYGVTMIDPDNVEQLVRALDNMQQPTAEQVVHNRKLIESKFIRDKVAKEVVSKIIAMHN